MEVIILLIEIQYGVIIPHCQKIDNTIFSCWLLLAFFIGSQINAKITGLFLQEDSVHYADVEDPLYMDDGIYTGKVEEMIERLPDRFYHLFPLQ